MYLHTNLNVYTASIVFGSVLTNWISPSAKDETEAFFSLKKDHEFCKVGIRLAH